LDLPYHGKHASAAVKQCLGSLDYIVLAVVPPLVGVRLGSKLPANIAEHDTAWRHLLLVSCSYCPSPSPGSRKQWNSRGEGFPRDSSQYVRPFDCT